MKINSSVTNLQFLSGDGEMASLIRAKDWGKTPLGSIENWPQSLRTTISIILNTKFPKFLFWGPELICFYNDAYRPSLGNDGKHPSILGERGGDYWKEIWHVIKPLIDTVLAGGGATWSEDQLIPIYRNGQMEDVYWTFSYSPVNDESGKPAGVFVSCFETTEKVKTLKKIEESEIRFRTMSDNIPNLAWMANSDGWIYWYNKKWYEYTGTTPEQMEGWGWESVHDPNELPRVMKKWKAAIETGNNFEMIFPLKALDGTYKQFLTRVLPIKNNAGEITQWFGTNTDITEQKKIEQSLKESEQRFRTMAENTDVLIAVGDETSNATYFNKAWVDFTGRPMDKLLKFGWVDLVHPDDNETYVNIYLTAFEKKVSFEGEFRALNKDGKYRYILAKGQPRFSPDGKFEGYISSSIDITDRKIAEESIKESEERFRTITEALPQLIWVTDEKGVGEFTSKRWESYSGIKPIGSKEWEAILHPDDLENINNTWINSLTTGQVYKCDVRLKNKSDVYRWHSVIGEPVYNNQKQIIKWIGAFMDINDQKHQSELIRENEIKLNNIIDASELGTWEINIKTGQINYSPKLLEIIGFKKDDKPTTADLENQIHPDDEHIRIDAGNKSQQTGNLNYICRIILPNKTIKWVETKGILIKDSNNIPEKTIGTLRDITEEKNNQIQLLTREKKFRLLADSMPQHIWTADTQGNLNYYNQSVFDYSGLTLEQINKDGWLQIVHPDDREENIKLWLNSVTSGKDFNIENRFRRHDGVYRWQLSRAIAQKDDSGNIQMWVGTSTDIDDRKQFSDELEKQVKERTHELEQKNVELERMNNELQSFAYISSHDLQEPLRKIQTFASRIVEKENGNLSEIGIDYFNRIQKSAYRMQTLIQDLLVYSRTSTFERIFINTDLNEILNDVKTEFSEVIIEKEAIIEVKEMCKANIIPFQFRQMLHNLISNALKFSDPKKPPHIKLKSKLVQGSQIDDKNILSTALYCHLTISDNGIGFDIQYKERIFEVFQRLHGKSEYSGTGIGLAIVKKIVENHNGIITVKSEINMGTTFEIYFPT